MINNFIMKKFRTQGFLTFSILIYLSSKEFHLFGMHLFCYMILIKQRDFHGKANVSFANVFIHLALIFHVQEFL